MSYGSIWRLDTCTAPGCSELFDDSLGLYKTNAEANDALRILCPEFNTVGTESLGVPTCGGQEDLENRAASELRGNY